MYDYSGDLRWQSTVAHFQNIGLNGHPRFYELLARMACLHADKNHDYAGAEDPFANFHACEAYGISPIDGVLTRITDKDERFRRWYAEGGELRVSNEGIEDTLLDRAVYTLILAILLGEERPCEEPKTGSTVNVAVTLNQDSGQAFVGDAEKQAWQAETIDLIRKALLPYLGK